MTDAELTARTLARNDRFLREVVEAHDFCPWARHCRESGGLERRVVPLETPSPADLLPLVRELASEAFAHVEVALLLLPRVTLSALDFERFVASIRDARAAEEPRPTFFCVAFHPDSPPNFDTPGRTVSLLRRSPDPTIQLVRAAMLDRARGPDLEDTIYVDASAIDLTKPMPPRPPSVSNRIARSNHQRVHELGPDRLLALLDEIRRS